MDDKECTKAILNAIYGFNKMANPKYDVIITLMNGSHHKANDDPLLMSEVVQLLEHLVRPTIYGKYITKFEVIQCLI